MGNDNNGYFYQGMHHAHDGWWGGPLHVIVLLVLLGLLIAGAVWLVRHFSRGSLVAATGPTAAAPAALSGPDPAVAALRMRYATGKVSREEFRDALADLTGAVDDGDTPPPAG
jgi:uncharacterized membrane protein